MKNHKRMRISDVMRLTGLSRSTVDRVLNDRPGVREDTRQQVEQAISSLGYAPSSLVLHQKARTGRIEVFLPEGTNPFFAHLRKGIDAAAEAASDRGVDLRIRGFDPYKPETIVESLSTVSNQTTAVITVGVDNAEASLAINNLADRGIRVVTIVSDVPMSRRSAYVGQDNFVAGRTAGQLMASLVAPGKGRVAVLIGHPQFRHLLDRQSGFQQALAINRPDLSVEPCHPYGADPAQAAAIVRNLMSDRQNLRGVYLAGGGQPYLIDALRVTRGAQPVVIGHEVRMPAVLPCAMALTGWL
ncbi:LacI family DNA-binding transcriptional regulator [uncultured Roseobacter sp.]|uniref:LacI family DNA-binding transcriptional regulator n=1 Tax=uncultured Roseobacter sp. TaxID=114847 RepID=UPI00260E7DFC|nr:LacI family DNA-binding transcriptional regulator [uncultured Roseobacter sp.]